MSARRTRSLAPDTPEALNLTNELQSTHPIIPPDVQNELQPFEQMSRAGNIRVLGIYNQASMSVSRRSLRRRESVLNNDHAASNPAFELHVVPLPN